MPARAPDDATLLRTARKDPDAFGAFYRLHALLVYRWFVLRVDHDRPTAAELTAETFAEALRSLPRFRGRVAGDGTAWLFGIARNLAREHHRTRRVRDNARRRLAIPVPAYDGALEAAEERIDAELLNETLEEALQALPTAQREAVWLRIVRELEYPQIAAATKSSEQAARLRVFRGLRALRSRLAPPPTTKEEC
jgi:RNA polymerase sigma factor (sigma-70 family)